MAKYKIVRMFTAAGVVRNVGTIHEGGDFANIRGLEQGGYIRLADENDLSTAGSISPTPDPKIQQENKARADRQKGKGPDGGGIASLEETLDSGKTDGVTDKAAAGDAKPLPKGKLPEDFPGYFPLTEAGIDTYGKARKAAKGDLTEINGIGDATAAKINDALSATTEGADEGDAEDDPEAGNGAADETAGLVS